MGVRCPLPDNRGQKPEDRWQIRIFRFNCEIRIQSVQMDHLLSDICHLISILAGRATVPAEFKSCAFQKSAQKPTIHLLCRTEVWNLTLFSTRRETHRKPAAPL